MLKDKNKITDGNVIFGSLITCNEKQNELTRNNLEKIKPPPLHY